MVQDSKIVFADAAASLDSESRALAEDLNSRAVAAGYSPLVKQAGNKAESFKAEYKIPEAAGSLFIIRIDGKKLSLRCKLFHLNEYPELIEGLSETARIGLLSSRPCIGDGGCKGPVTFVSGGKEYALCRHNIQMKKLMAADAPAIWDLLSEEDRRRKEVRAE